MKPSEPYEIRSNDRLFLVGKTGSGKTEAAKHLVWRALDKCVFYDMTGKEASDLNAPVLHEIEDVKVALFAEDPDNRLDRLVYAPEVPTYEGFEDLCRLVYNREDIHLIADELLLVYRDGNSVRPTTDHHLKILTNGRKVGVGMTGCSQRPTNVPLESISESEHQFCFKLKLPADRDRMKKVMGTAVEDALDLDRYHYYYDHDVLDSPARCDPLDI